MLFSRLRRDDESTIVTRHDRKNNVFYPWGTSDCQFVWSQNTSSARVANFTLISNSSFSPLVKQIPILVLHTIIFLLRGQKMDFYIASFQNTIFGNCRAGWHFKSRVKTRSFNPLYSHIKWNSQKIYHGE